MSTNRHVDLVCGVLILAILAAVLGLFAMTGATVGETTIEKAYETGFFDTSVVHTLDITIDDWEGFLADCEDEEYVMCDVTIDGETVQSVGIRAKGNTSLSQVKNYGNDRYSFKVEFDHYQDGINYQGLDKLSLNNIIQDNTYMKDYLSYQLMASFGVDAPLCSYIYLTVNGEDWGLYLAVEAVEESFLERNYGSDSGELYKPDSSDMGGGRGGGKDFEMPEDFGFSDGQSQETQTTETEDTQSFPDGLPDSGEEGPPQEPDALPDQTEGQSGELPQMDGRGKGGSMDGELPEGMAGGMGGERPDDRGGGFSIGSDDVKLVYTDDDDDSYSNIFDNAKTAITDTDKTRLIQSLKTLNEGEDIACVVDMEEVMRYFVVHNFVCNFDSYTGSMIHNYYLYEEDGVLSMIPWDYNLAFGGFQQGGDATSMVNYPIDAPVSGGSTEDRPMIAWIFADETYTQQYHELFSQFLAETFESGAFAEEIDRVTALVAPYVDQDPTKFCTYEEFETGVAALKSFCLLRAQSIRGQLEGTIPATSDGQQADSSGLVDASAITLSDMGTMNAGGMEAMGGGGPGKEGFDQGPMGDEEGVGTGSPPDQQTGTTQGPGQGKGGGKGTFSPGQRTEGDATGGGENNPPGAAAPD